MSQISLEEKEQIEIDYWVDSPTEKPGANSLANIINKMMDVPILLDCLPRYNQIFLSSNKVLELGAGQGWAYCVINRVYPKLDIITTDICPAARSSLSKWEHIFDVRVSKAFACRSYQIPCEKNTLDTIFCFASAHHFVVHRCTLNEIMRVLKPGGNALYFYEPSTPVYLYWLAKRRIVNKRPTIPEDVLRYRRIQALAKEIGLNCLINLYPCLNRRPPLGTIYYWFLGKLPILQKILLCATNYHFIKNPLPLLVE